MDRDRVGAFDLQEQLHRTPSGTVYRGQERSTGEAVTIEVVAPQLDWTISLARQLQEQLQKIVRLQHPHIIPVEEIGQEDTCCYLVMPAPLGQSLSTRLKEAEPLPADDIVEIARQLAAALDYAHNREQVHGNIHPTQIFLDEEGTAALGPFGLTQAIEQIWPDELGLPPLEDQDYWAPERIGGAAATPASDIYALGRTLQEVLRRGRKGAEIPTPVEQVLLWSMAEDPARRPGSAGELVTALRDALTGRISAAVQGEIIHGTPTAPEEPAGSAPTTPLQETGPATERWETLEQQAQDHEAAGRWAEAAAIWRRLYAMAWRQMYEQVRAALTKEETGPEREEAPPSRQEEKLRLSRLDVRPTTRLHHEVAEFAGQSLGVTALAFSYDGQWLISGAEGGHLWQWSVYREEVVRSWQGHDGDIWAIACSPDTPLVASASEDGTVGLWDIGAGRTVGRLRPGPGPVNTVVFSPDGARLALGGEDGTVRLYDIRTAQEIQVMVPRHQGPAYWVDYAPNGQLLASASGDGTVGLWNPHDGEQVRLWDTGMGPVNAVAFAPNGYHLAAGGDNGRVYLWEAGTGEERFAWTGADEAVNALAFSPDGALLAAGSAEGTIRLYSARHGWAVVALERHTDWISALAFSPDGSLLASGSYDGTIWLWVLVEGGIAAR